MKYAKALLVGAAFAALTATSANAADLTPITPAAAPVAAPAPAPTFSWAGPYAGISGFASWCGPSVICVPPIVYGAAISAGYNATFGAFVVGAEARFSAMLSFGPFYYIEANARAAYAIADRVLVYGKAGLGYSFGGGMYYTFGAGTELAVTDAISVFAEITPNAFFGGSPLFRRANIGINFHF